MRNRTKPNAGTGSIEDVSTSCPFSGIETGIDRELDSDLGPLTVDELATLVRNEWRRRLGSSSYSRNHSQVIIRALFLYALDPKSPVRSIVVEQLILWELVALGKYGLSRSDIQREFRELPQAVRQVLVVAGMDFERSGGIANQIAHKLGSTLGWPESAATARDVTASTRVM